MESIDPPLHSCNLANPKSGRQIWPRGVYPNPSEPLARSPGRAYNRPMRKLRFVVPAVVILLAGVRPASALPTEAAEQINLPQWEDQRIPATSPLWHLGLDSPRPATRARTALALGRIGYASSIPPLNEALKDPDASVRTSAAFGEGLVGDSSAFDPLAAALKDPNSEVRMRAAEALSKLGTRRAAPLLGSMLSDSSREVVWQSLTGLWRVQDSSAVTATLPLLTSPDSRTRQLAVYALERTKSLRAPAAVRPLCDDPDEGVRMWAVRALGRLKDVLGEPRLIVALHDPSWKVRVNAVGALSALSDTSKASALIAALKDPSPYVRRVAADALGAMKFWGSAGALAALAHDSTMAVRASAGHALVEVKGVNAYADCKPFLGDTADYVRARTLEGLGEVRSPDAWPYAIWGLEKGGPVLRATALDYFSHMKSGRAMPFILKALESDDDLTAGNAADAIAESGDSTRTGELVALYDKWKGAEHAETRLSAVNSVVKLWPAHEILFLKRALKDDDRRVRVAAAEGLKTAGQPAVPDSVTREPLADVRQGWFAWEYTPLNKGPAPGPMPQFAEVRTTQGAIKIALESNLSENTVLNFVTLARKGYFDGILWHRVVPNFVIQGGDPHGDGQGGPGYTIRCEMNTLPYDRGMVGMALSGKDTGGSQFFITQSPQPHLNGRYTIFGHVLEGMDVVDRIDVGDRILSVVVP